MSRSAALIFFILIISYSAASAQSIDLRRGLMAHYSFDNDFSDQSEFGSHGTSYGATLDLEFRCGNGVAKFNGLDDYIDFGNPDQLNMPYSGLTVSFLFYPTKLNPEDFQLIVGKWGFDAKKDQFAVFINVQNLLTFAVADGKEFGYGVYSKTIFEPFQWYHIILVWNRSRKVGILVNGEMDKTGEQTGSGYNSNSEITLKAGRQVVRQNRPFEGYLDEIRIYNRSLSLEEMKALYLRDVLPCNQFTLKGTVYNQKSRNPIGGANIIFEDLDTGSEYVNISSQDQSGYYETILPIGYQFGFYAEAKDYISINDSISTARVRKNSVIEKDLYLVPIEIGGTVRLNNIFFDLDKAILKDESFPELDRLLKIFEQVPGLVIEIGGHTDSQGSDEYNRVLSDARANAVRTYLLEHGIGEDKVTAVGYGESEPIDTNDTEEGRAQNRRVEFKIISKD